MRVDPQHGRLAPLVPRASRASRLSCLSSTCASQQRALLSNVRFSATCASQQRALLASTPTDSSAFSLSLRLRPLGHQLPPLSLVLYSALRQHVFCHVRLAARLPKSFSCASQHERCLPSSLSHPSSTELSPSTLICFLPLTAPRPLLGALQPCPPIGRRHATPPPCLSSLRKQAEEDVHLLG